LFKSPHDSAKRLSQRYLDALTGSVSTTIESETSPDSIESDINTTVKSGYVRPESISMRQQDSNDKDVFISPINEVRYRDALDKVSPSGEAMTSLSTLSTSVNKEHEHLGRISEDNSMDFSGK
jgi:hypothetical protein